MLIWVCGAIFSRCLMLLTPLRLGLLLLVKYDAFLLRLNVYSLDPVKAPGIVNAPNRLNCIFVFSIRAFCKSGCGELDITIFTPPSPPKDLPVGHHPSPSNFFLLAPYLSDTFLGLDVCCAIIACCALLHCRFKFLTLCSARLYCSTSNAGGP
jgi:hypothetical protein